MATTSPSSPRQNDVQLLRRQCLQLIDPIHVQLPDHCTLRDSDVQQALYNAIFNAQSSGDGYNLPQRYVMRILKLIIDRILEPCGPACHPTTSDGCRCEATEIDSDLLDLYTQSFISPYGVPNVLDQVPVTYIPYLPHWSGQKEISVTIFENPYIISGQGTTGLRTWEAALALGEYMCVSHGTDKALLRNVRSMLELGTGTGLCAMLAAKLGVTEVYATDGDQNVVQNLRDNLVRNNLQSVIPHSLLWGSDPTYAEHVDLIIGADVTYEPESISYLIRELSTRMAVNPRLRIVLSATIRNMDTYNQFRDVCARAQIRLLETDWKSPDPPVFFYFARTPIKIIELEYIGPRS